MSTPNSDVTIRITILYVLPLHSSFAGNVSFGLLRESWTAYVSFLLAYQASECS